MQIDRVLFPITTLGPGNRIVIWTVGCPHKCYKCSNPELWDLDEDKEIAVSDLVLNISKYRYEADGITITGGDPFFQGDELYKLLKELRRFEFKDILVYTGYSYESLIEKNKKALSLIDVLIDGRYIDDLNNDIGILGSSNQNIIILNSNLKEKYEGFSTIERKRQNFIYKDKIISVGIPKKIKSE